MVQSCNLAQYKNMWNPDYEIFPYNRPDFFQRGKILFFVFFILLEALLKRRYKITIFVPCYM